MLRYLILSGLFALIMLTPVLAEDSDAAWKSDFDAGNAAYGKAQYQEAERLLSKSAAAAEAFGPQNARLAASLNSLALVYDDQGKFTNAESMYKRALSIFENIQPPDQENIAATLSNLSDLYREQGKFNQAEPLCTRALEIRTRVLGQNNADTATSMNNLALLYYAENKYTQAEPLLLQALAVWKQQLGANDPKVATCMNNLALLYSDQGKYSAARELYENALAMRKSSLGAEHPSTTSSMINLASLEYALGRYDEAQSLYQGALAIEEKHGSGNLRLAASLVAVASLARDRGDLAEAASDFEKALNIRMDVLGTDHDDTALVIHRLAGVDTDLGRYSDAERLYKQLLERDQRLFGDKDPKVASDLDNLASVYKLQNKGSDAQQLQQQANQIKQKLPGGQHVVQEENAPGVGGPGTGGRDRTAFGIGGNGEHPVRDKWALVVGISSFKDPSINLRFAAKDATDFSHFLTREENFKPDHVKLLTDENATRENIIGYLGDKWLRRVARKDDLVVVYLSTHGSNSKREAVGVNFVVAEDTNKDNLVLTALPMDWLMQGIKDGVQCDRSILILDVCHSGAAAPAEKGLERDDRFKVSDLPLGTGQIVLASSESDQISWESKQYPNGVFTHCLIEGLRRKGASTTIDEAFQYMREKVEEEVLRDRAQLQTPVCRRAWSGDDAVLSVTPIDPRPGLAPDSVDRAAMRNLALTKPSTAGAKQPRGSTSSPPHRLKSR